MIPSPIFTQEAVDQRFERPCPLSIADIRKAELAKMDNAEQAGFSRGLEHAIRISMRSRRGKIAAAAIQNELMTIRLMRDLKSSDKAEPMQMKDKIGYVLAGVSVACVLCFTFAIAATHERIARQEQLCAGRAASLNFQALVEGRKPPCP